MSEEEHVSSLPIIVGEDGPKLNSVGMYLSPNMPNDLNKSMFGKSSITSTFLPECQVNTQLAPKSDIEGDDLSDINNKSIIC
jgi:hypothetical protein